MIELKRSEKEKGRVEMDAPKPTIIGNCEGWNFIVGKKLLPEAKPKTVRIESLQSNNKEIIHKLSTKFFVNELHNLLGGLWTICG